MPTKYQYSLIDYGEVQHLKYKNITSTTNDMDQLMVQIILGYYRLYSICIKRKIKFPNRNVEKTLQLFKKNKTIWNKIVKILYVNNKEWFDSKILIKDWLLINKVYMLFSAFNRKQFLKCVGWKIHIPNFIPKDDIIFMVKNMNDNKKIIKYFMKMHL